MHRSPNLYLREKSELTGDIISKKNRSVYYQSHGAIDTEHIGEKEKKKEKKKKKKDHARNFPIPQL